MSEITRILDAIAYGDPHAAEQLLPLVYDELRKLAAAKMAQETPGQTLQATALVHEAYLRLVASGDASAPREHNWNSRGHFFAAAAEAMRRILIERARRIRTASATATASNAFLLRTLVPSQDCPTTTFWPSTRPSANWQRSDHVRAELVKFRFFAGLTMPEAAQALGISLATAERHWEFARVWLYAELAPDKEQRAD